MFKVNLTLKSQQLELTTDLKKLLMTTLLLIYSFGTQLVNKDIEQLFTIILLYQKQLV
jgi:hypothetical protein